MDLDFGFTPATNVLQLSRIALKPGQSAEVPVVWLDLGSASLIALPQTYERRGDASYWYEAPAVPYRALLEIAPNGLVQSYPGSGGLWRLRGAENQQGRGRGSFVAFDLLQFQGEDSRELPLEVRRAQLESLAAGVDGIKFSQAIESDGAVVFAHACKLGLEGIV